VNSVGDRKAALRTEGLTKFFSGVRALDGLTLAVRQGEVTSIVGPNGSGKSTLINLLTGILPFDEGLVILDDRCLRVIRARDTPGHGLTRTFQEVRLFDQMSVWDNVLVVLTARGVVAALRQRRDGTVHARARAILETVRLWDKREALAMELSYGQRKLLEIGRALAMDARIVLFDEPFAGLYPQMIETVKSVLRALKEGGRTIVFVEHNLDIIRDLSDSIIVLSDGRLLAQGEVEATLRNPHVVEAYLGT
jgi:ABC-type branched-subunit amino acid transport system ATPase component